MSPQFRAITENTTFEASGDPSNPPNNPCSSPLSVAEVAWAANAAYALHKIESISSDVEHVATNPLDGSSSKSSSASPRKRASDCFASYRVEESSSPFLSSYGSAFLSGIFADIAQVSGEKHGDDEFDLSTSEPSTADEDEGVVNFESLQPCKKKIRTSRSTSFGGHKKSYATLSGIAEGADSEESSPTVVSPRPNKSAIKIQLFNDQVRELQNLAFPSFPHMPVTVSSSSCTSSNHGNVVTPRDVATDSSAESDDEPSAYGWFVSTDDDDDAPTHSPEIPVDTYKLGSDADLAFKAATAPRAENHDVEVQQALAADTIDDVLGDFF
ncbi:hypothetical protein ACHAXS_003193 [Conticribra weissflogii]